MSAITEPYYKEMRLDARAVRLGNVELLLMLRPRPVKLFRAGLYPVRRRRPKHVDFVYFGVGPFELRIWGLE